MSLFDFVLIAILTGFTLFGYWFGLLSSLGSLVGTVFGVYLASRWYVAPSIWLAGVTGWSTNFTNVVSFIILFLIINRLIGFVFFLLDKAFSIITHLPVISGLNRLLGAVLGFAEGVVVLGITIYFISRFPLSPAFMAHVNASPVASWCSGIASLFWPLVPEAIRVLQNALQNITH